MNKVYKHSLLLSLILFLATSCAVKKQAGWLNSHQMLLAEAATSKSMDPEAKLDVLANSYVKMMHQSLNFTNPKKGVNFAKTYSQQNGGNIGLILKGLKSWKGEMNTMQAIGLGLKMVQKPYFGDLLRLFPRFQRKFRMYKAIAGLTGKVKNGLMNLGGNKLKDLGK